MKIRKLSRNFAKLKEIVPKEIMQVGYIFYLDLPKAKVWKRRDDDETKDFGGRRWKTDC